MRPAPCAQMQPSFTTMDCKVAGYYKASFRSPSTRKPSSTTEIFSGTPETCEDLAAITSSPNNVPEGSNAYLRPSVPNSPTGRHIGTHIDRTASRQPSTPSMIRQRGRAPSTVADSDGDLPLLSGAVNPSATPTPPIAANLVAGRLRSPSRLQRKREHKESDGNDGGGSGEGNMCKRSRVLDSRGGSLSV
jgi:hypothetical protein